MRTPHQSSSSGDVLLSSENRNLSVFGSAGTAVKLFTEKQNLFQLSTSEQIERDNFDSNSMNCENEFTQHCVKTQVIDTTLNVNEV